jgi:hypothetical protein
MTKLQQEELDSGISSAAYVGNSPSCMLPSRDSRPLDPPCSSFGPLLPCNQVDSHGSPTNLFSLHHMDSPSSLVPSQSSQLRQQWEFSSFQHPLGRYPSKGTPNLISLKSKKYD